jgi:hypothetical protein
VTATWHAPDDDRGSPLVAYSVVAVDPRDGSVAGWRNVGADVRSASLDHLENGVTYDVYVLPWNALGIGDASPMPATPSAGGAAGTPPTVGWASLASSLSPSVYWGPPVEHGEPVTKFNVVVIANGQMRSWAQPGPGERSLSLGSYPAGTDLDVYVFAQSASGYGPLRLATLAG